MTLRVLTVDDSRTILAMLHHTLSNAGFEVLQAEDGKQGLDVLKAQDVDVVITDINMPVMDGIEGSSRMCGPPASTIPCPS
jgi:two-component system, chemotaxis family, chemotaxis protein CheY